MGISFPPMDVGVAPIPHLGDMGMQISNWSGRGQAHYILPNSQVPEATFIDNFSLQGRP
jgi:hypothetical protein